MTSSDFLRPVLKGNAQPKKCSICGSVRILVYEIPPLPENVVMGSCACETRYTWRKICMTCAESQPKVRIEGCKQRTTLPECHSSIATTADALREIWPYIHATEPRSYGQISSLMEAGCGYRLPESGGKRHTIFKELQNAGSPWDRDAIPIRRMIKSTRLFWVLGKKSDLILTRDRAKEILQETRRIHKSIPRRVIPFSRLESELTQAGVIVDSGTLRALFQANIGEEALFIPLNKYKGHYTLNPDNVKLSIPDKVCQLAS